MPNRILRDWTDSETIDLLSVQAERFFTRLIMKVDDFGRFTANLRMLKSILFPLKTDVRETDITRWLAECEKSGLIALYNVASKEYLQIINFKQALRQKTEKYPAPTMSSNCVADDTHTHSNCSPETKRSRNEVETETEPAQAPERFDKKLILENPFGDKFLENWILWKNYKKSEFKFLFKSIESEQAAMNDLVNKSGGNEDTAIKIIHQSLANGWKGLFELKKDENGQSNSKNGKPKGTRSEVKQVFDKFYTEG
jgi:hypothetical protein